MNYCIIPHQYRIQCRISQFIPILYVIIKTPYHTQSRAVNKAAVFSSPIQYYSVFHTPKGLCYRINVSKFAFDYYEKQSH